jgi:beta-RFAP synthase
MITVRTPCRLHFGLLAMGESGARQYGGVGLMVRRPDVVMHVQPSEAFAGHAKAVTFARRFAERAVARGLCDQVAPVAVRVERCPRPHTGMGTGTQLGMAVSHAMASLSGMDPLPADQLASLVGRGERSAIGAWGFVHGGLIVEGGKRDPDALSPLLINEPFPEPWRIVLICPRSLEAGLADERERTAFAKLPPIDRGLTAEMCRLVLLGMVPSMLERDLAGFGQSLYTLQQHVGRCFAEAQGGIYAHPLLTRIVDFIRSQGVEGVGQSSWGPTLYAVTQDAAAAQSLSETVRRQFELADEDVTITAADNHGLSMPLASSSRP